MNDNDIKKAIHSIEGSLSALGNFVKFLENSGIEDSREVAEAAKKTIKKIADAVVDIQEMTMAEEENGHAKSKFSVTRDLIEIAKTFYAKNWFLGTSGNLSKILTQNPLRFIITVSGTDKESLTSRSFVEVEIDSDGYAAPAKGSNLKPSGETKLHAVIYKHTKAGAIIHVHSPQSLLMAERFLQDGEFVFKELEVQKGLGFADISQPCQIPIFSNKPDLESLAQDVVSKISANQIGFLIEKHGLFVWGKTASDAKRHVELIHHVFEYELLEPR